jgi:hypothetical protein
MILQQIPHGVFMQFKHACQLADEGSFAGCIGSALQLAEGVQYHILAHNGIGHQLLVEHIAQQKRGVGAQAFVVTVIGKVYVKLLHEGFMKMHFFVLVIGCCSFQRWENLVVIKRKKNKLYAITIFIFYRKK